MCSQFNINYFGVSEVEQWWTDFGDKAYGGLLAPERFWQFKRSHSYGMGQRPLTRNPRAPLPLVESAGA